MGYLGFMVSENISVLNDGEEFKGTMKEFLLLENIVI